MSEITTKAQELLEGRLDSVRKLEQAHTEVSQARERLVVAERAEAEAWSVAAGAGWTPTELKRLGFPRPASRRGGRPRGPRTTAPQPAGGNQ